MFGEKRYVYATAVSRSCQGLRTVKRKCTINDQLVEQIAQVVEEMVIVVGLGGCKMGLDKITENTSI